ncbi:hypothetical protein PMAYCL1PPCAC_33279 [Pristionchus mayeri]|uniref:Uncharacterized protein n=1 Tax=Pristionchus mayeri TaxID=1317129 RepID=A0AAN5D7H5_9BILA|nr:hypothetical protein PMAYCL1PPCAC_03181 [Pristionchus mayeri]GMR33543.1 hypothetical protein PMAYCL1PPCAC_03738 [Pristionchus mayeri]GMR34875.1 hypothetical protein PMAYCL1PPCAC_05070 [Pristionchus mayeri]GMR37289.1 hypothetical protein PMAYCL1PPCAC_07484 [Pristionchus mayeri]GMR37383.1 hypothetical protein PMAYCL1PPCAC_07578 [Pristionchus mayeri]
MRTRLTILHWNHLKQGVIDGTRPVVGKKSYTNPSHKNKVWRKVRKDATHTWRTDVKNLTYLVRGRMIESPETTEKKRKIALAEQKKLWETLTRPLRPHGVDSNLEEEAPENDDEGEDDALLPPPLPHLPLLNSMADEALGYMTDEE